MQTKIAATVKFFAEADEEQKFLACCFSRSGGGCEPDVEGKEEVGGLVLLM